MNIAIDGPSGAGKSTIAKRLAAHLKIAYLDTGAMYRAVGLKVFNLGIDPKDITKVESILSTTNINIAYTDGTQSVTLDGQDVSNAIRAHQISSFASDVSAIPAVRVWLVELQRKIANATDSVLDGRDIGTYVLPNADYKFFLTADLTERAKRRYLELQAKGESTSLAQIEKDIATRDHNDSTRTFAPLKKADDAIEVDSTHLTIDKVVQKMLEFVKV